MGVTTAPLLGQLPWLARFVWNSACRNLPFQTHYFQSPGSTNIKNPCGTDDELESLVWRELDYYCVLILHANIPQKAQQQMKQSRLQGACKSTPREDGTLFSNLAQIERVESALGKGGFVRLAQVSLTSVWQHNISESWLIFSFSCFSLSRMPRLIVRPKC